MRYLSSKESWGRKKGTPEPSLGITSQIRLSRLGPKGNGNGRWLFFCRPSAHVQNPADSTPLKLQPITVRNEITHLCFLWKVESRGSQPRCNICQWIGCRWEGWCQKAKAPGKARGYADRHPVVGKVKSHIEEKCLIPRKLRSGWTHHKSGARGPGRNSRCVFTSFKSEYTEPANVVM